MKYVLYHAHCYDGFGAAYAAWKKFGDKAKYIPVSYGKPLPDMPDAKEIYIVDFSYSIPELMLLTLTAKVVVLDHHKTAEESLKELLYLQDCNQNPNLYIEFNMDKSGALIAWEYFHPGAEVPDLIKHISDRDLWQFKMPGSKEVHAALVSLPFDFEVWDNLSPDKLIVEGAACLRFQQSVVDKTIEKSWVEIDSAGRTRAVVNTSCSWSEVGHALLQKYPSVDYAMCFTSFKDSTMYSLRSEDSRADVSAIAKANGGGGHRNAAGYSFTNVVRKLE